MKTPPYPTVRRARRSLFTLILLFFFAGGASLQAQLATWDFEGETTAPTTTAANVTATAAVFGPGVSGVAFFSGNGSAAAYSANDWSTGGLTANDYLEVSVVADPCYTLNVNGITFDERRSGTGPTTLNVIWSDDASFLTNSVYGGSLGTSIPDNTSWRTQTFTQTVSETQVIFRIYGYNAEGSTGTWRFDNISIEGTAVPNTEAPTVTCADVSETYATECPGGIGANTVNDPPNWNAIGVDGSFPSAAGGIFTQIIDVSTCVSDNDTDPANIEYATIDSYAENVTDCSTTIVNEYAFRDACGNVADETLLVKFIFNDPGLAPTITCPADATVECGMSTDPAATGTATAEDDCSFTPVVTFSDSFAAGECGNTGVITRTWTADDGCGGSAQCTQLITIEDTTPPTVTCADFTTTIDGGCGGEVTPNVPSGGFGSVPANGIITVGLGINTGATYALDLNGCVSNDCTNGFNGIGISLVASVAEDADDGCGVILTNTYSIRDACGNISADLVTIVATFADDEGPAVTCADFTATFEGCPAGIGANTPNGEFILVGLDGGFLAGGGFSSFVDLTGCVSDNCTDLAELEYTLVNSFLENVSDCSRTVVNEYVVRDACGNLSEDFITTRFTVENTSQAVITCPADVELPCGSSTDPAVTGMATASDACGDVTVTFEDDRTMQCNNGTYFIIRTWTAAGCGEPVSCEQLIALRDDEAPEFDPACETAFTFTTQAGSECVLDATISLNVDDIIGLDDVFTVGGLNAPTLAGCVSDNCALDEEINVTVTDISISHASFCSRIFSVTFVADDGCFNESAPFALTYTVTDNTAPVFDAACQVEQFFTTSQGSTCPADATFSLNEGDEIGINDVFSVGNNELPTLAGCITDNCGGAEALVITVDAVDVTDQGSCARTFDVTFIADDGCGNDSEPFTLSYTITDDTAPVFDLVCQIDATFTTEDGNVCPADATISLNEGDVIDVFTGWTVGGVPIPPLAGCVADDCTADADLNITVDDITVTDDGTCSRTITVTFIADDGCGNDSDPFVCNYVFVDNTGPEVSFNGIPDGGTYTLECDLPSDTWDPLIDFADLDISDVCSDVDLSTLTEELTQLYGGPCQNNLLTRWQQVFTVEDVCGNETTYTLFTEIIDTTPPVFDQDPADVTIECTETSPAPQLEAFDSCSEVVGTFQEVRIDGPCPNSYTLNRIWTAVDGCGNVSQEVQIVTVEDTTPPEIIFADEFINPYEPGQDVFIDCAELGGILQIFAGNATAVDVCGGETEMDYELQDLGSFDCAEFGYIGAFVSTFRARDACGNVATATINWFLVDETAPTFQNLPPDVCAPNGELPPVAAVQAVDECDFAALTFSQSDPVDCDGGGQYVERTWTAVDGCGNEASYTQRITLGGTGGLTITIDLPGIGEVENGDMIQVPFDCDEDIVFSLADLEAAISVADGCGSASGEPSVEISLMDEGDCADNGYLARYRVSVSAMDACGNAAELTLTVEFVDQTPPEVTGETEITLNCGEDIPMPTAVDACGEIASMTFSDSAPIEVSCPANPIAYDRTWTVTDDCGNAATFTQSIIVLDTEGPVFSGVPADACNDETLEVTVTAVDACTGQQAAVSFSEEMSTEAGCGQVLTRTWTAADACGNMSTSIQQVFFDDDVAPEITFTNDLLFGLESGDELFLGVGDGLGDPNDPLLFTAEDVLVTDNCAMLTAEVSVETTISEDCAADGYLARYDYKFVAADPCGNEATAKLTVFYLDDNAPDFFNTPEDQTVICAAVPEVADLTVSDDYDEDVEVSFSETQEATPDGLLIIRTWTAIDDCGNVSMFTREILVEDNDLSATFSFGSDVIECNSDDNRLGVTAMGGTPPYSYQWELTFPLEDGYITTDPTQRAILFTMGYITQSFSVLITDANGCELLASVTVVCDFSDDEGDWDGNGDMFSLNVYPNPTRGVLNVRADDLAGTPVTVALYNPFGQVLSRIAVDDWTTQGTTLDATRYPGGTYWLRLSIATGETRTRKIVLLE